MVAADQWPDFDILNQKLLAPQDPLQRIENDIQAKLIDIPDIHVMSNKFGIQFFNSLASIDNLTIFLNPVVKSAINYKWPTVRNYTLVLLFIPFFIMLAAFVIFSNVLCGQIESFSSLESRFNIALIVILYILAAYFLVIEIF